MELTDNHEVRITSEKLGRLEQLYEERSLAPAGNPYARELTLESLKLMIDQLKGEIARFEARSPRTGTGSEGSEDVVPIRPIGAG